MRSIKRYKHFVQLDSGDCAATCFRSIAHFYGHAISRTDAEYLVKKSAKGASMLDLIGAFSGLGALAQAQWCSVGNIVQRNSFPCIVHIRKEHFVIVLGASKNSISISDPENRKKTTVSITRFAEEFAVEKNGVGAAIFFESLPPGNGSVRSPSFLRPLLIKALTVEPRRITIVGILALIAIVTTAIVPLLTKRFFDSGVDSTGLGMLSVAAGSLLGAQICIVVLNATRTVSTSIIQRNLLSAFSEPFLSSLVQLDYNFFLTRTSGDILQRLNDQSRIESFASKLMADALTIVCGLIGGVFGLILISPIGAAATAVCSAVVFAVSLILLRRRVIPESDFFDASAKARGAENEIARCILSIKAAAHERQAVSNWKKSAKRRANAQFGLTRLDVILASTSETLVQCAAVIILLLVTWPTLGSHLVSAGDIGAFSIVMGTIFGPLIRLASISKDVQEARLAAERSESVVSISPERATKSASLIDVSECAIRFESVSYAYPGSKKPALRSVDFIVEPRTTCAIIGGSGSGKSTAGLLLAKLLQPAAGEISLDGKSLCEIDSAQLRSSIGFVLQDGAIYDGTISFNISGRDDAEPESIWNVLRICCLDQTVAALRAGISTKLGAGFEGLSGGQKQRLLLARALYGNPSIIILDEATSALDVYTEERVLQNLKASFPNTTTVIIAHRTSTVRHADKVIRLKEGAVDWIGLKADMSFDDEQVTPLIDRHSENLTLR